MSALALAAGKYGAYIWPAYGASAILFAWMIADTLISAARLRRQARGRQKGREE